ncbi:MAG: DUF2256 domain-containing protein [Xanthomonadales bacterium]|nr:DUF2256 domain-containing protein [Xanthomonadales bacterium]
MKKSELPTRTCPACKRPFAWRKKWRNCWEQVGLSSPEGHFSRRCSV